MLGVCFFIHAYMLVVCPLRYQRLCMFTCLCVYEPQALTDPGHPVLQASLRNYHRAHDHPRNGKEHHHNFKISAPALILRQFRMPTINYFPSIHSRSIGIKDILKCLNLNLVGTLLQIW